MIHTNAALNSLDLKNSYLSDAGLKALSKGMSKGSHITLLNLSKNKITSEGIKHFSSILANCMVCELDISDNPLGDAGMDYLKEPLSFVTSTVRVLSLVNCGIGGKGAEMLFRAF